MPATSVSEAAGTAVWRLERGLYVEARLEALGVLHGVTTRALGDMKESANRRAALETAGLGGRRLVVLDQVHGTTVHEASAVEAFTAAPSGDGLVSADRASVCGVYVADCLAIFLWDRDGSAVGVFHSGWRGTASGMPRAAVRSLRRYGLGPERLAAAVGPHVGPCCYRVGPEVIERFRPESRRGSAVDLGEEARLQLIESGVDPVEISVSAACTSCLSEEFFSYRRDKAGRRQLAFAALPSAPKASPDGRQDCAASAALPRPEDRVGH